MKMKPCRLVIAFTFIFYAIAFSLIAAEASPGISGKLARAEYEKVKLNFDAQNYADALDGFQGILKEYPESSYAKDSLLFSGHCYHLLKKRDKAYSVYCKYLGKYGKYGLRPIDYFYIGQNFRILEHKREAFWYLKQAAKETAKDAPLSNEINTEMRRCLITSFWAQPPGFVHAIADTDKDIWILRGASAPKFLNSLSRFNKAGKKWTVYNYEDGYVPKGLSSMVVDSNSVWMGTNEDGLLRYNFIEDTWRYYTVKDGLAGSTILSLVKDGEILWIGGKSTITKFDINNNIFEKFVVPVDFDGVCSLVISDKYVWAAGRNSKVNSLVRLNKDASNWRESWTIIPSTDFNGTDEVKGLNPNTGELTEGIQTQFLSNNEVCDILVDSKYVWVATRKVIDRFNKKKSTWDHFTKKEGLPDNFVKSLVPYKNNILAGVSKFGTIEFDSRFSKVTPFQSEKEKEELFPLLLDGDTIWFQSLNSQNPSNWIYYGLKKYSVSTGEWSSFSTASGLLHNRIYFGFYSIPMAADDKFVWIGNPSGVNRYDKNLHKLETFLETKPIYEDENLIYSLQPDGNDIWISIRGKGLFKYDKKTGQGKLYLEEKRLSPAVCWVENIRVDKDYLYLATNKGLIIYDKNKDKWFSFNEENEFLGGAWLNNIRIDGDFLWLGSRFWGLARFDKKLWLEYKEIFPQEP